MVYYVVLIINVIGMEVYLLEEILVLGVDVLMLLKNMWCGFEEV